MSKLAEKIRLYYAQGLWDEDRVRHALELGKITESECREILQQSSSFSS